MIELLQIGSLAMTKVSASPLEGFVPEIKLFSIPYLMRDREHFWDVLNGEIGQGLLKKVEAVRLKGMGGITMRGGVVASIQPIKPLERLMI